VLCGRSYGQRHLTTIVPAGSFQPGDTLRTGINLFTDAVARAWLTHRSAGSLQQFGDSLARGITGFPLPYTTLSKPRDQRSPEATTVLGTLSRRAGASRRPPGAFLDSLARDPNGSLVRDPSFSRDLADVLRIQGLPPDSQTNLVQHLDSLGGQDGSLTKSFAHEVAQADTVLLTELLPWLGPASADGFRQNLLRRAAANASAVLGQPRPSFDPRLVDEVVRRLTLRTISTPPATEAITHPVGFQPATDQWGTFVSGWAPIRSATGATVAILGVDVFDSQQPLAAVMTGVQAGAQCGDQ
jgi:hypothetical protein